MKKGIPQKKIISLFFFNQALSLSPGCPMIHNFPASTSLVQDNICPFHRF